jgi:KUP system potassium uptake protein
LALLALGVVFGDIGTSPLYAYQTAIGIAGPGAAIGIASLIIWTLILVVGVKYVLLVMKADYHGEGGIFALLSLIFGGKPSIGKDRGAMACLLVFGAALLFGDGAITPAISVLSAVEGLATVNPEWKHVSLPLTLAILGTLFYAQRFGTNRLGRVFGPVMLVWFLVLAGMGLVQIIALPSVLEALNPVHGVRLLLHSGWVASALVGAVVLSVTGAEALYADLGHFGRPPILHAWRFIVFPSLALNYLGQAALVLRRPECAADTNLFFLLLPNEHWRAALVVLATAATVIASQALISGVFSLASQAMDLGYLPRLYIQHTSAETRGQIHIPVVNALLGFVCIMLVLGFRTSDALAGAYGIAVTGAMAVTSIAFVSVARARRGLGAWQSALLLTGLLCLDLPLFGACLTKLSGGGIVPILLALGVAATMLTWRKGRDLVRKSLHCDGLSPTELGLRMERDNFLRTPGTVVFVMRQSDPAYAVARILEQYRRTRVMAENVLILLLEASWKNPFAAAQNIIIQKHSGGLWEVHAEHGYMIEPDVPFIMEIAATNAQQTIDRSGVFFIIGQEIILTCGKNQMRKWEKILFGFLARNALPGPNYLNIPPDSLIVYNWLFRLEPQSGAANP